MQKKTIKIRPAVNHVVSILTRSLSQAPSVPQTTLTVDFNNALLHNQYEIQYPQ